jgi:hypothetical protein
VRSNLACESLLSLFPAKLASHEWWVVFWSLLKTLLVFERCAWTGVEASFEGKSESKLSHSIVHGTHH